MEEQHISAINFAGIISLVRQNSRHETSQSLRLGKAGGNQKQDVAWLDFRRKHLLSPADLLWSLLLQLSFRDAAHWVVNHYTIQKFSKEIKARFEIAFSLLRFKSGDTRSSCELISLR